MAQKYTSKSADMVPADHASRVDIQPPRMAAIYTRFKRKPPSIQLGCKGHGGHTQSGKSAPTAERMARDLANLIEHYKLDKITAVGHSMGALTLWQYIRDFGLDHLEKVCFIDQSPKLLTDQNWPHGIYGDFDENKASEMMHWLKEDFAEAVLKLTAFGLNSRAKEKYLAAAPRMGALQKLAPNAKPRSINRLLGKPDSG